VFGIMDKETPEEDTEFSIQVRRKHTQKFFARGLRRRIAQAQAFPGR